MAEFSCLFAIDGRSAEGKRLRGHDIGNCQTLRKTHNRAKRSGISIAVNAKCMVGDDNFRLFSLNLHLKELFLRYISLRRAITCDNDDLKDIILWKLKE